MGQHDHPNDEITSVVCKLTSGQTLSCRSSTLGYILFFQCFGFLRAFIQAKGQQEDFPCPRTKKIRSYNFLTDPHTSTRVKPNVEWRSLCDAHLWLGGSRVLCREAEDGGLNLLLVQGD